MEEHGRNKVLAVIWNVWMFGVAFITFYSFVRFGIDDSWPLLVPLWGLTVLAYGLLQNHERAKDKKSSIPWKPSDDEPNDTPFDDLGKK